jgi:hypothetical protein
METPFQEQKTHNACEMKEEILKRRNLVGLIYSLGR